jgi:hypothetical protein
MANVAAICTSFKVEILNGLHALGTSVVRGGTGADTFKIALYAPAGSLGAATTVYSATNEVSSAGYTAAGTAIVWTAPAATGTTAYTTPNANVTWTGVTLTKAVAVYTFSSQTVTAGNFTLTMPTNDSSTGLLRIA